MQAEPYDNMKFTCERNNTEKTKSTFLAHIIDFSTLGDTSTFFFPVLGMF
jgi:hypothetical protein